MSRIRGPYVRFCERDEANLISSPHPTRFAPWNRLMKSCPEGEMMKKRQIHPLEIVSDQIVKLQERLESSADPREKSVLVKRLDNLKKVLEFLALNKPESTTAGMCA